MHFFAFWKQTFSPRKDKKYWLTFDWRFRNLSQSEIRVHWWTHNSKNPTNLGRREFNSTLHQSSHGFATRVHGFATKTKALAREIPPATQASQTHATCCAQQCCDMLRWHVAIVWPGLKTSSTQIFFMFILLIIYMKKLLDSDWLRTVQFFLNTVQKRGNWMRKKVIKRASWLVNEQRSSKIAWDNWEESSESVKFKTSFTQIFPCLYYK